MVWKRPLIFPKAVADAHGWGCVHDLTVIPPVILYARSGAIHMVVHGCVNLNDAEGLMLKWKILATVGLTFGVLGTGWGLSAQQDDSRVFELRIYKTVEGKRTELADRFRDHTAAMFEQAGMENVGYWNAATGEDTEDTFIYMLGYPSLEARDEMWATLGENPDFQRIIVAAERSDDRKLVNTIDARMLVPTGYSALR